MGLNVCLSVSVSESNLRCGMRFVLSNITKISKRFNRFFGGGVLAVKAVPSCDVSQETLLVGEQI